MTRNRAGAHAAVAGAAAIIAQRQIIDGVASTGIKG